MRAARGRENFQKRIEQLAEAAAYLKAKKCPTCGCGLRRNLSMSGWYQCNALGAQGFQSGDGIGKAPCSFQFFFDPNGHERAELVRIGIL